MGQIEDSLHLTVCSASCIRSISLYVIDPTCILLHPRVSNPQIEAGMLTKIVVCLSTRSNKSGATVCRHLSINNIKLWDRVRRVDGGDTMNASSLVKSHEDSRDASYVRVSLVDIWLILISRLTDYPSLSTSYWLTKTRAIVVWHPTSLQLPFMDNFSMSLQSGCQLLTI